MLKTKKVTLLFNIYAKDAWNSFTNEYSLYINNENNKEKKMNKNYTYKILKGTQELSVYKGSMWCCFITDGIAKTLEDKKAYFKRVFK